MSMTSGEANKIGICSRIFKTDEIPAKAISERLEANAEERAAIAKALDLLSLDSLCMDFKLHRSGRARFKFEGQLFAVATQSCVVTLEPIECEIDERISMEFWPPEDVKRLENEADEEGMEVPLDGPEPIQEGQIDVGHLAYEHFAAALEPYPRRPGASFDWEDPRIGKSSQDNDKPFAELARLKNLKGANSN